MSNNKTTLESFLAKYDIHNGINAAKNEKEISEADKKRIEELEKKISEADKGLEIMLSNLNKEKDLEEPDKIIIRANLKAGHLKEVITIEKEIKTINPGWIKNTGAAIQNAMNKAGEATEIGAGVSGSLVGRGLKPSLNALKSFWNGFKTGISESE